MMNDLLFGEALAKAGDNTSPAPRPRAYSWTMGRDKMVNLLFDETEDLVCGEITYACDRGYDSDGTHDPSLVARVEERMRADQRMEHGARVVGLCDQPHKIIEAESEIIQRSLPTPFRFLDLPVEIRMMVYKLLLNSSLPRQASTCGTASEFWPFVLSRPALELFQTCSTMYSEIGSLYKYAILSFEFCNRDGLTSLIFRGNPNIRWDMGLSQGWLGRRGPIASQVQNIHLHYPPLSYVLDPGDVMPLLEQIIGRLPLFPALRTVYIDCHEGGEEVFGPTIDFLATYADQVPVLRMLDTKFHIEGGFEGPVQFWCRRDHSVTEKRLKERMEMTWKATHILSLSSVVSSVSSVSSAVVAQEEDDSGETVYRAHWDRDMDWETRE